MPESKPKNENASLGSLSKHSAVFAAGQILSRISSFLLLPFYTHYLTRSDYGVIAILDLTAAIAGIALSGGLVAALSRYHFEAKDDRERSEVWWTGVSYVAALSMIAMLALFLVRRWLGQLTLGALPEAGSYYALMIPTIGTSALSGLCSQYLRVRRWSAASAGVSLAFLLLNIALNVTFVGWYGMGVKGVLLGNMLAGFVRVVVWVAILARSLDGLRLRLRLLGPLFSYSAPLMGTSLLMLAMHQADRYLLVMYLDLEQVGVYSLAYTIGNGVNRLLLMPFNSAWAAAMHDIAARPDAPHAFAKVFRYFVVGLALLLFAISLGIKPIFALAVKPDYWEATNLVPIICLAFLFYSCHLIFRTPAMVKKQTARMLPAYVLGTVANIIANVGLIPLLGVYGAAWATVITFVVFCGVGYAIYRQIDDYPYPFIECGSAAAGMCLTVVAIKAATPFESWPVVYCGLSAIAFVIWACVTLQPWKHRRSVAAYLSQLAERVPVGASSKRILAWLGR